jgi:hypothetical protein
VSCGQSAAAGLIAKPEGGERRAQGAGQGGQPRGETGPRAAAPAGQRDEQATQTSSGAYVEQGSCFYYLHTHAADGIIHIESPVQRTYTLGEFFDEWGQPLSQHQAGPDHGKVTVIVNGKVFQGNPRDVPLGSHENLQVEVGTPLVEPETVNWSGTGL